MSTVYKVVCEYIYRVSPLVYFSLSSQFITSDTRWLVARNYSHLTTFSSPTFTT